MAPAAFAASRMLYQHACVVGAEVMRVFGHLRLERVADEERRDAGEHDHRHDPRLRARRGEDVQRLDEAKRSRPPPRVVFSVTRVRDAHEEDAERQVDQDVRQQPPRGPEQQHEAAADRRAQQDRELAAARVEPDRARQIFARHHVVDDELRRGGAHDAGGAVNQQNDDGMPHLERAGEEEHPPCDRREHEKPLRDLDQFAAVVAIGERAGVQRKQQERHPVTDHGKPGQRRRVERLEHHPVADDVLDVVGRHRHESDGEISTVGRNAKRCKPRTR